MKNIPKCMISSSGTTAALITLVVLLQNTSRSSIKCSKIYSFRFPRKVIETLFTPKEYEAVNETRNTEK